MLPPTPRVVLDTNTALALWWFDDPRLTRLHEAIATRALEPIASPPLVREWQTTLARLAKEADRPATAAAHAFDQWVTVLPHPDEGWCQRSQLPLCRDPEDQKFLECAFAHAARWLITRDKALLRLYRHRLLSAQLSIILPEAWIEAHKTIVG